MAKITLKVVSTQRKSANLGRKEKETKMLLGTRKALTFENSCAIKHLAVENPMAEQKIVCYTLDLEHDYAGLAPAEEYETFSHRVSLDRLLEIIRRHDLKITVFATGKVLSERRDMVEFFQKNGAEIELHGYQHVMYRPDCALEVRTGVEAYHKYFSRKPAGYRSPGGVVSPVLMEALAKEGIRYDSSLIPSFRWRVYQNLKSPIKPYRDPASSLLELPIGVVPKVRFPIAASYIRLVGLASYKLLFALFGAPAPLVYLFHLVDLIPTGMRKELPFFWRKVYAKGQKKGFDIFEATVVYFKKLGYRSEFMSSLYKRYTSSPEKRPGTRNP